MKITAIKVPDGIKTILVPSNAMLAKNIKRKKLA
jgi:hypothetical protein